MTPHTNHTDHHGRAHDRAAHPTAMTRGWASDGTVRNIIYFLQPELPAIVGVAALRPQLRQACSDSAVPCYFIDLQPLWVGHPEYTAGDGIQASTAGATVIADQIWATLRQHCIAQ